MNSASCIRVLQDPPLDGPTNMARDETLMTRAGSGESQATLRLYQWDPPTISLGYFQRYAEFEALPDPAGSLDVVRRLTGGGAILHDLELTYSLALPLGHDLLADGPNHLYEIAHDAVIGSLAGLQIDSSRCGCSDDSGPTKGPFFCFARRHAFDVLTDREKIAGSAQRRTRTAVLQHGSIVLGNRFGQQPTAPVTAPFEEATEHVRTELVAQFATLTGHAFEKGELTSAERAAEQQLIPKYAGPEWTRRM